MSTSKPTIVLTKKASRAAAKEKGKQMKVIRKMYRELGIEETGDEDVLMVPNALLAGLGLGQEHSSKAATQQTGFVRSLKSGISNAVNILFGPEPPAFKEAERHPGPRTIAGGSVPESVD